MNITEAFLPASAKDSSARNRRLPYLAGMNLLLLFYFPVSALLRFLPDHDTYRGFLYAICGSETLFALSLALLKAGRSEVSSYVGSLGILVNVALLAFLTPFAEWTDIYRIGVYLLGAIVANALVSLERRQVVVYMAASLLVYAAIVFFRALPTLGGFTGEGPSICILFLVLFATLNVAILLLTDLNRKLVELAESEGLEIRERAEGLRALVGSAAGALETGRELVTAAGEGRARSQEIRSRLAELGDEAAVLRDEAASLDAMSATALERVAAADSAVERQNRVIADAGAELGRIGAAIGEVSAMAGARRGSVAEVGALAERQADELKGLFGGIDRIVESSRAVMQATSGIVDVSEKTQLLAMNASIEAAHAGASGRGFAVIASEIRKLSQDTQSSTRSIAEAISANEATVKDQAAAIGRFGEGMERMTRDVKSTFETLGAMVESLIGMESATARLGDSTSSLLRLAGETKASVAGVVEGLRSGAAGASSAKDFAAGLSTEIALMLKSFAAMDAALEKASAIGERNLSRVAQLESSINASERAAADR